MLFFPEKKKKPHKTDTVFFTRQLEMLLLNQREEKGIGGGVGGGLMRWFSRSRCPQG